MGESTFPLLVERVFSEMMDTLSASPWGDDLDLELGDGLFTIGFEDGSKLILNRQEAVKQIWLATPWGGQHFALDTVSDTWNDVKSHETLQTVLRKVLELKLGGAVEI